MACFTKLNNCKAVLYYISGSSSLVPGKCLISPSSLHSILNVGSLVTTPYRVCSKLAINSRQEEYKSVISSSKAISSENPDAITSADLSVINRNEPGVLEPCEEDVSDFTPFVSPSFNLAAYANKSYTLQQFIKMGVDISKLERRKEAVECILKLDFEKHVKMHLRFLHDVGLPAEEFGRFVTKNPYIFEQSMEDLKVRINYLEAKKFSSTAISTIITKNPRWLNFSTTEIDKRLGFFQRSFILSGEEVRQLATMRPSLITYTIEKVMKSLFAVKEDMGLSEKEAKEILLKRPKVYSIQTDALKSRFDYVHNIMEVPHEMIVSQPSILLTRNFITKERHEFLKELGRAQYNPKLPGYVALDTLVKGTDVDFCRDVAKTSIDVYNAFLKTS